MAFLKVSEKGPHFIEQSQEQKQNTDEAPPSGSRGKETLRVRPGSSVNTVLSVDTHRTERLYHTVSHLAMPLVGLFMLCGVNVGVMAGTSVIQLNEEFLIGKKGLCHCHLEVKENEYWNQLVTLQTSPD